MTKTNPTGIFPVLLIAGVSLVVHLVFSKTLGFHRDEFLYLSLGNHLAAGYWSNPPFIGLIGYLSQLLPWDPLFNTRFIPAVAGTILIFVTGLITKELGGNTYATILSALILSFSLLILRAFSMLQPVPFDILFWTLILFCFLKFANTGKPGWIVATGIFIGFGMLNKYMVGFLVAGMILVLPLTPYRKLIFKKYSWLALIAGLLIFAPNLVWQFRNGFPVLRHMQELKETQLVNVERMNIIFDQLFMCTTGFLIWLAGLIWLLVRGGSKYRIFGMIYLAVLALFLVLKGKSYYMAGLYPFLFAAGGVAWEKMLKNRTPRIILLMVLFLSALAVLPMGIPIMNAQKMAGWFAAIPEEAGGEALLRWEDGQMHPLPQDYADMLGWDELANIVIRASDSIDKDRIMIYGENYGYAGAVDLYGKPYGLPEASSFSDSYLLWIPDSLNRDKDFLYYINNERGEDIFPMFGSVDSLGSITNRYAREYGATVYLCRSPKPEFFEFYKEKVGEVKKKYLE